MNRLIVERSVFELESRGFTVALNRELPPNDGCISLGQAVIACEKLSAAND
jgi:hydrogenase maturation protein HypF